MRILFCNFEYPPLGGGGGVINALLAEELAKRHDVTVLTSLGLAQPADSEENGVRVVRVPVFFRRQQAAASMASMLAYLPMGVSAGRRLTKSSRFDVINTHFVLPTGPVGQALSRFAQIPNVLSVHGGDLYDPSKWSSPHRHALLRAWVRRLLRRADRVVGQSSNTLQNMRQFFTPEIQGTRIPLAIKRPMPDSGVPREHWGLDDRDIVLVTVGRLVARKAIDQLIEVMHQLRPTRAALLIIGSGPQEQSLRQRARDLGVEDRIRFLGQVDEVEKFRILRASDALVSTSQHEGFGLVFLEAMACGLPIICYDNGGQTDFLEHRQNGFVLTLNDTASFTESCQALIRDADSRKRMGQQNLSKVENFFIDRCAAQYVDLFDDVIAGYRNEHTRAKSVRS